ncbi:MAG: hypothetical protein IJT60_00890 [Clostridia bacterium]|nr:hypothetical protein [Clostridia bacterium]
MNEANRYRNVFEIYPDADQDEDADRSDAESNEERPGSVQGSETLKKSVPKPVWDRERRDPYLSGPGEEKQIEKRSVSLPVNVWKYAEEVRKINGIDSDDDLLRMALLSYCSYLMTGRFKGQGADFMTSVVEGVVRRENERVEGTLFKTAVGIETMMRIFSKILKWDDQTVREELEKSVEEVRLNRGIIYSNNERLWDF